MDRISKGHPIAEIADLYYFYVVLGEDDPSIVEKFMGFSFKTARAFFDSFLKYYLDTADATVLADVTEKASFICYIRLINKIHKKNELSGKDREMTEKYMAKTRELAEKLDTLVYTR